MGLYFLALLPFGLLSAWLHRHENHRSTAGFGFLAALAPVLAKGWDLFTKHKQGKSAAKQAEEQPKLEAQQADALARQQWEAQQGSPAAQGMRFKNTLQLGRLAGAMGGLDKLPPSIANYYLIPNSTPPNVHANTIMPTTVGLMVPPMTLPPCPTIIYAARSKWVGELRRSKKQACVTFGMRGRCSELQKKKHKCIAQKT